MNSWNNWNPIINPVEATATTDDTHINVVVTKLC